MKIWIKPSPLASFAHVCCLSSGREPWSCLSALHLDWFALLITCLQVPPAHFGNCRFGCQKHEETLQSVSPQIIFFDHALQCLLSLLWISIDLNDALDRFSLLQRLQLRQIMSVFFFLFFTLRRIGPWGFLVPLGVVSTSTFFRAVVRVALSWEIQSAAGSKLFFNIDSAFRRPEARIQ